MQIYFLSSDKYKIEEVKSIFFSEKIEVLPVYEEINEIQNNDMGKIALDKALKAFKKVRRPVFVEHTGLLLKDFGNLPGGLTRIFWDSLQADKFSDIFSKTSSAGVTAKSIFAFCDGKRIHTFEGEIEGHIICPPRGSRENKWDCVFEPCGYNKTFAELGNQKNEISMRKLALEKLRAFLEENYD